MKEKNFDEPWQKGETLNTGIGQGYVLLTPVEIGIMTSVIVNGGKIIRPNIIKSIKNGVGDSNVIVNFSGITFTPGEYLYADEDGVIVIKEKASL